MRPQQYSDETSHHLDVPLSAIPHTTVINQPIPVLRLSLISGHTEPLGPVQQNLDVNEGLLVLGGEVVNVLINVMISETSTITAVPYWFHIRGKLPLKASLSSKLSSGSNSEPSASVQTSHTTTPPNCDTTVLSTKEPDSPCNQSLFILSKPLEVLEGKNVNLDVVWREGAFSTTVESAAD